MQKSTSHQKIMKKEVYSNKQHKIIEIFHINNIMIKLHDTENKENNE